MTSDDNTRICSLFPNSVKKCDIILAIRCTSAAFSLIGCICIIFIIWLFKKYKVFAQRLILYLTVAAFLDGIAYMFGGYYEEGSVCTFQAFWLTYFEWSVLLWVCCITFNLFVNSILSKRNDKLEWLYHIVSWGFPALMASLPLAGNSYGPAGVWCWIKEDHHNWRFSMWYGPLFAIIGLLFITYTYIAVDLKKRVKAWEGTYSPSLEREKEVLKQDILPLRIYPLIYLILSVFPVINRIQNATGNPPIFALMVMHVLCSPLTGAMNAIAFSLDKETTERFTWIQIKAAFLSHFVKKPFIGEYPCTIQSPGRERPEDSISNDEQMHGQFDKDENVLIT